MNDFELNPEWESLEFPEIGDLIQLKIINDLSYLVKCIVINIHGNIISAKVDSIFDWNNGGPITSMINLPKFLSKKKPIINTDIKYVQKVIKKII